MSINPDLLGRATSAGRDLADAERRVLLARGAYHAAIRRLHLAGASLREVADALSFSHQRVQQIVDASGGTWWRRVRRTRNAKRDAICTWCDRPSSEVSKLVAGPNICICDACLESAGSALHDVWGASEPLRLAAEGSRDRCGFCGRRTSRDRSVVVGPAANVCSECMRICRDFMENGA